MAGWMGSAPPPAPAPPPRRPAGRRSISRQRWTPPCETAALPPAPVRPVPFLAPPPPIEWPPEQLAQPGWVAGTPRAGWGTGGGGWTGWRATKRPWEFNRTMWSCFKFFTGWWPFPPPCVPENSSRRGGRGRGVSSFLLQLPKIHSFHPPSPVLATTKTQPLYPPPRGWTPTGLCCSCTATVRN